MKKFIFAVLALCCVLSCTKEPANEVNPTSIKFVAAIGEDDSAESKTTVSETGKVAWVIGDEVSISHGAETKIYKVTGVDEHRYATLEVKSGTGFSEYGDYTATYGDVNNQWYYDADKAGSNCPMEAEANANGGECKFAFKNSCGVVAVKANTGTNKIAQIRIGSNTLNFASPQALDGTYLVAVTPGEPFTEVAFVKDDGSKASKTISSASVEKNRIRDLDTDDYFSTATIYDGFEPVLLSGKFTIDADGHQIRFTRGNLWIEGSILKMESNQYDFRTLPKKDAIINGATAKTPANQYGLKTFADRLIVSGFRYLQGRSSTIKDLDYIINKRTNCSTIGKTDNARWALVNVGNTRGIMLFPDEIKWPEGVTVPSNIHSPYLNWSDKPTVTVADFAKLESCGVVFLPAAGYANLMAEAIYSQNEMMYYIQSVKFDIFRCSWSTVEPSWNASADYAGAMRLVKDIN